jgi:hypothetical protein
MEPISGVLSITQSLKAKIYQCLTQRSGGYSLNVGKEVDHVERNLTRGWTGAAEADFLWLLQYYVRGPVIPSVSPYV